MYCTQCQSPITPGGQFCDKCGARLGPPAPPGPHWTPPPQYGQLPPGPPPAFGQPGYIPPNYGPHYTPPGPQRPYATWADRVLGFLIDQFLVGIAMFALGIVGFSLVAGAVGMNSHDGTGGILCLLFLLFPLATLGVGFYNRVYLVATRGASIGQGVMKLRVVSENGGNLTMGSAFIRLLAQLGLCLLPMLGLVDLLWPLWDDKRQTLHDKAVGCYVIKA